MSGYLIGTIDIKIKIEEIKMEKLFIWKPAQQSYLNNE